MRQLAAVLLALYGATVLAIVAWPTPVDEGSRGLLFRVLRVLHRHGIPEFINYTFVEFMANVAMFVPLGILIGLLLGPRFWWLAILLCAGASVAVELYQFAFLPSRFATVRDVAANSLGGSIGAACAGLLTIPFKRSTAARYSPTRKPRT